MYAATDVASIGAAQAGSYTAIADVKAACDAAASCNGFVWDGTHFKTFTGSLWEGAVGKVGEAGRKLLGQREATGVESWDFLWELTSRVHGPDAAWGPVRWFCCLVLWRDSIFNAIPPK